MASKAQVSIPYRYSKNQDIQNAYQGFAKEFQFLIGILKTYGGTAGEMARLSFNSL